MTKLVIIAVVCIASGVGADVVNKKKVEQVATGECTEARASWWGFDPEDSSRFLQAAIDSRVPRLIVDQMDSAWITDPIFCVSDQEIFFESGVEVLAKSGSFTGSQDSLFSLLCVTNVTLHSPGATLRMRRADYDAPPYVKAEWRSVLNIRSSSGINIVGLTLAESGGDGIYLGTVKPHLPNVDIHIKDVICDKNYRLGIAVISAENLLIEDTIMRNAAGTSPAGGIDFEPNYSSQRLKNCVMRNCLTENNQEEGYSFSIRNLSLASEPVSIRIENCRSVGDLRATSVHTYNSPRDWVVSGSLTFVDCSFETSREQAVVIRSKPSYGMDLIFTDCVIKDCAADILLTNSSRDEFPVGGIQLERLHIQRTTERPWICWQVQSALEPITEITGSVLIETGNKQEQLTLDSNWTSQTILPRFLIEVPRLRADLTAAQVTDTFDLTAAEVTDTAEGLRALSPIKLRLSGTYMLFAKDGQEVIMTGELTPCGSSPFPDTPLIVRSTLGKIVDTVTPTNFNQVVEFRFKAAGDGFYSLQFNVGLHAFALLSANVPVAVAATNGRVGLIGCTGQMFLAVPKSTERFAIEVAGQGEEAVKVVILAPNGTEVWERESVTNTERFTAQGDQGQASELWQIRFAPPSVGTLEDFSVKVLGVPGFLFLHPERYWSFDASIASVVSEPVSVDASPRRDSRHWMTVRTTSVPLNWEWPANAASARLTIVGMNRSVVTNFTSVTTNWVWQASPSEVPSTEEEHVYTLTLTFYNNGGGVVGELASQLAVITGAFGLTPVDLSLTEKGAWCRIDKNVVIPYDAKWDQASASAASSQLVIARSNGMMQTYALSNTSGYFGWEIQNSNWGYGTFDLSLTFPGTLANAWEATLVRMPTATMISTR